MENIFCLSTNLLSALQNQPHLHVKLVFALLFETWRIIIKKHAITYRKINLNIIHISYTIIHLVSVLCRLSNYQHLFWKLYLLWLLLGPQPEHADRADARHHVQRDGGWPGQTWPALCSEVNTSSLLLLNNWTLLRPFNGLPPPCSGALASRLLLVLCDAETQNPGCDCDVSRLLVTFLPCFLT